MPVDAEVLAGIGMFFIDMETYFSQEKKQKVSFSDDSLPSIKDLYDRYKQCRDFELERFWKNSIFVWTFLTLCFTALGFLATKYLEDSSKCKIDFYIITSIVAFFGVIFSYVWVLMAQGLKAWYKVFEHVIWRMENVDNIFGFDDNYLLNKYFSATSKEWLEGRPFSPTKIVVLIGYLLVIFWLLVIVCNSVASVCNIHTWVIVGVFSFLGVLFFIFIPDFFPGKLIKSSTLRDSEADDLYNQIRKDLSLYRGGAIKCNCVEVHDNEVKFWHNAYNRNYVFNCIKEIYSAICPLSEDSKCLVFDRIDIYSCINKKYHDCKEKINDLMGKHTIEKCQIKFCKSILLLIFDKKYYEDNLEDITQMCDLIYDEVLMEKEIVGYKVVVNYG